MRQKALDICAKLADSNTICEEALHDVVDPPATANARRTGRCHQTFQPTPLCYLHLLINELPAPDVIDERSQALAVKKQIFLHLLGAMVLGILDELEVSTSVVRVVLELVVNNDWPHIQISDSSWSLTTFLFNV